jgi:prepilin-type N-terminal cleavage/methylation domain-containing protein
MRVRAFTLIELLIVVAIIAILAAIAVPNFLEAQTRSKVSRAKSDMRSIATAIESYAVDNNKYPYYYNDHYPEFPTYNRTAPNDEHFEHKVSFRVTSPIAYITSLPRDVFDRLIEPGEPDFENTPHTFHYSNDQDYTSDTNATANSIDQYPVRYVYSQLVQPGSATYVNGSAVWMMFSHGPDRVESDPDDGVLPIAYDPTNGTVSNGDIYSFGPGLGFK